MHAAAHRFIAEQVAARGPFVSVLEIGSRDINGSVRGLFGDVVYEGLDLVAGAGVDVVGNAVDLLPAGPYDAVVCCEVFEHEAGWPRIVWNAHDVLMPAGVLLLTMAGPGRAEHSAVDGGRLRPGEFYANVDPANLTTVLMDAGFADMEVNVNVPGDLYAACVKG